MLYHTAHDALKRLGELAGYRYPIYYYCFRRWMANEANRKLNRTPLSRLPQAEGIHRSLSSPPLANL
jgi:hypothetical protein